MITVCYAENNKKYMCIHKILGYTLIFTFINMAGSKTRSCSSVAGSRPCRKRKTCAWNDAANKCENRYRPGPVYREVKKLGGGGVRGVWVYRGPRGGKYYIKNGKKVYKLPPPLPPKVSRFL